MTYAERQLLAEILELPDGPWPPVWTSDGTADLP
jgi:hypothetical protein